MQKPDNPLFQDLTGQKFGRLKVIEYAGPKWPDKRSKGHQWKVTCECGIEKVVFGLGLKNGETSSCGCYQKEAAGRRLIDLTGQQIGKLKVVKLVGRKRSQSLWLCKCECGTEKEVPGNTLRDGRTKSCGCGQGNFIHGKWGKPGYMKMLLTCPIRKMRHYTGSAVAATMRKRRCSKNGESVWDYLPYIPEQLKKHLESLWEPWMTWDNYGGRSNEARKTWHIDHIVPQKKFPYRNLSDPLFLDCWALSNLRPLEKKANFRKGTR